MTALKTTIFSAIALPVLSHAEGHAKVDLLSSSSTYQPSKPISAAIRMDYEDGWHGYWINPGETGMKTEVKWKLPPGWKSTELQFPLPQRSSNQNIHSYDYHGTIIIPFDLHAPANATGDGVIEGEVTWLACNHNQCVSGNAMIRLVLTAGEMKPTAEAATIQRAIAALPQESPQHQLKRTQKDGKITLEIQGPDLEKFAGAYIFPITEQALDPAHDWKWELKDGVCTATGPANEYAEEEEEEMSLKVVIAGGKLSHPILLKWTKKP